MYKLSSKQLSAVVVLTILTLAFLLSIWVFMLYPRTETILWQDTIGKILFALISFILIGIIQKLPKDPNYYVPLVIGFTIFFLGSIEDLLDEFFIFETIIPIVRIEHFMWLGLFFMSIGLYFWSNELLNANRKLESLTEDLMSFNYSVTHDLRNPLVTISGFSSLLLENYSDQLAEEAKEFLGKINNGIEKMDDIIENMLKLAQITQYTLNPTKLDITTMVKDIVNEFQASESVKKININISERITINGDEQLIPIVLRNLLSNAIKFTSKTPSASITIGNTEIKGKKTIFVKDNGVGFNIQNIDRLFIPFQRLHSQNEYLGTGIGLSIAQKIIHKHQGRIWAESTPNKGTTFYFTLNNDSLRK